MPLPSASRTLPPQVLVELEANAVRIKAPLCAQLLWDRVLTQEERQRLGGNLQTLYYQQGTAGIWMKLRGVSVERAVLDVAHELDLLSDQRYHWLLRELGEPPYHSGEGLDQAIASGALVLVERPRAAYWAGQPMEVDWERRSALWEFFWELCRRAKARQSMDRIDLGESAHRDIVAKQKYRLRREPGFPHALADRGGDLEDGYPFK